MRSLRLDKESWDNLSQIIADRVCQNDVLDALAGDWCLDLGLADAIHDRKWTSCDDVSHMLVTKEQVCLNPFLDHSRLSDDYFACLYS